MALQRTLAGHQVSLDLFGEGLDERLLDEYALEGDSAADALTSVPIADLELVEAGAG